MGRLNAVWLKMIKAASWLPHAAATGLRRSRKQAAEDAAEAERLDRIRNPSKYLGNDSVE